MSKTLLVALSFICAVPLHAQTVAAAAKSSATKPVVVTILGPDGAPVVGARVVVMLPQSAAIKESVVQTDAAGRFALNAPLKPDQKSRPPSFAVHVSGFALAGAFLVDGKIYGTTGTTLRLTRPTTLSGTVRDGKGRALPNVAVRLTDVVEYGPGFKLISSISVPQALKEYTVKTDAAGRWTMADLPTRGMAWLVLADARFVPARVQSNLAAQPVDAGEMVARVAAIITGRVVDEKGKPLGGINISAQGYWKEGQKAYGSTTTGADGTFRVTGLDAGTYDVAAKDPGKKLIANASRRVKTVTGKSVSAPAIVLSSGALVQGIVKDAFNGAPLAGVTVINAGDDDFDPSKPTGKDGRFQLRVRTGQSRIYINTVPEGFLRPERNTLGNNTLVTLKKGETKSFAFTLERGLTLQGTAFDSEGHPAKGAILNARAAEVSGPYEDFEGKSAVVDARGKWIIKGLKPGKMRLKAGGEWDLPQARQVELPARGSIALTLRKIALTTLAGRVVTPSGQPVAGARAKIGIITEVAQSGSGFRQETVTTDSTGRFQVPNLRPDIDIQDITISKPGFRYQSGGKFEKKGGVLQISDTVLVALSAVVSGRVVDADGKPVAGARVFAPAGGPNAWAQSDAMGRFELSDLPEGETRVLAAAPNRYGEVNTKGGALEIVLKPVAPSPRDVEKGRAILFDIARRSPWYRYQGVESLAPHDLEGALQLADLPDDRSHDATLLFVLSALLKADPKRAQAWAMPQLDAMTPQNRLYFAARLASGLAESEPELARTLQMQARQDFTKLKPGGNSMSALMSLAKLAAKLEMPDAGDWWNKALTEAVREAEADPRQYSPIFQIVKASAPYDLDFALFAISQLKPDDRPEGLGDAFDGALEAKNFDLARQLFDKIAATKDDQMEFSFGQAAIKLIKATGQADPQGALKLARRVKTNSYKSEALAWAAQFQARDEAIKLWREAAKLAPEDAPQTTALISLLSFPHDPALSREVLLPAVERVETQLRTGENNPFNRPDAGALAYALSLHDAAASRLLLEAAFGRATQKVSEHNDWDLMKLARAMTTLDPERALQMSDEMEKINKRLFYEMRREIAQTLLADKAARREIFF